MFFFWARPRLLDFRGTPLIRLVLHRPSGLYSAPILLSDFSFVQIDDFCFAQMKILSPRAMNLFFSCFG